MELERQVQIGIVEAALGIVNDPKESKAVRRKHRLVFNKVNVDFKNWKHV